MALDAGIPGFRPGAAPFKVCNLGKSHNFPEPSLLIHLNECDSSLFVDMGNVITSIFQRKKLRD